MKSTSIHDQSGITLIESLVAIVVVALGILGILGVQLRTLADTQTGVRRAQAIRLIEDLSERTKVNPSSLGNIAAYTAGWGSAPAAPTDCGSATCTTDDLARYDINRWKQLVQANLPLGDANVFVVDDEATSVRRQLGVMISWRENERKKADGTDDSDYLAAFTPNSTGTTAAVTCPANRSCHLQYIQLTSRCEPYLLGGVAFPQIFCPV